MVSDTMSNAQAGRPGVHDRGGPAGARPAFVVGVEHDGIDGAALQRLADERDLAKVEAFVNKVRGQARDFPSAPVLCSNF